MTSVREDEKGIEYDLTGMFGLFLQILEELQEAINEALTGRKYSGDGVIEDTIKEFKDIANLLSSVSEELHYVQKFDAQLKAYAEDVEKGIKNTERGRRFTDFAEGEKAEKTQELVIKQAKRLRNRIREIDELVKQAKEVAEKASTDLKKGMINFAARARAKSAEHHRIQVVMCVKAARDEVERDIALLRFLFSLEHRTLKQSAVLNTYDEWWRARGGPPPLTPSYPKPQPPAPPSPEQRAPFKRNKFWGER